MAVTRIKNNQITDATIVANSKVVDYSISSAKLANNLTYGSDLTITGNLTVNGNTTTIDTTITSIEDPVLLLASGQTSGTPTVDIGFIGSRGNVANIAFVWDESASEFITAFTSTGETNTTISISSYANFHTNDANIGGNLVIGGNVDITGNITSLTVTGNVTGGNLLTPGLVSATSNITGGNLLTGGTASATGTITGGNLATAGTASAGGNVTGANINTGGLITATGNVDGGNLNTAGQVSATANITGGNLLTGGLISATSTITSSANITGGNLLTGGEVSATSTITGGNLATGGTASATGNITGGNVLTGGLVSATSNITGGNVLTGGLVSATGNIDGGNLSTAGTITATGNIDTSANVNALSGNINSVGGLFTGNITVLGNINGAVTVVGNSATFYGDAVTGNGAIYAGIPSYTPLGSNVVVQFAGNANSYSQINFQNVSDGTSASTDYIATADNGDDSNYYVDLGINSSTFNDPIDYPGFFPNDAYVHNHGGNLLINPETAGTLIKFMVGGTDTPDIIATMSNTELAVTGIISAAGNVTGGNLLTSGLISATSTITSSANITGGNVLTGGLVSATGTITSAANVVGGNITTAGNVSATGNVTGANINTNNIVGTGVTITSTGELNLAPTGNITANSKNIISLADPINDQDAATKAYVDSVAQGLDVKASVTLASANALPSYTYDNGTAGVGATLTATTTGALSLDGQAVTANARVLIKNETASNAPYNGIYVVTVAGDGSTAYELTRATDFDNGSPSGEIPGAFTFVEYGNTLADTGWVCTTNSPVTVGTTDITFAQFSGAGSYTAGAGLSLTGTQFNVLTDGNANPTTAINGSNQIVVPAGAEFITPNIGAATGTSLSATANITGGNVLTSGLISATSTITSAANVIGGNVLTSGLISATSTITSAANVIGGNLTTAGQVSATSTITGGNLATGGTISGTGNITGGNVLTSGEVSATANIIGGNILSGGSGSFTGNVTAANFFGNIAGNIDAAGSNTWVQFNDVGDILGASAAFTFDKSANLLTVSGNVQGGNLLTAGLISATGTITSAANVVGGNITTAGEVSATSTITGGNLATGGTASATGNITGGNVLTGGLISATSTITSAANVIGGNLTTAGQVSATANITGGNVLTSGLMSATANITGGNVLTSGEVSATSTITGGNLATGGTASATGNITGGNVLTGGLVSATGTGTFGNITVGLDGITSANTRITINSDSSDVDLAVNGDTVANVFYIDAGTGTASFGTSSQTTNAIVAFNSPTSILMPVGNTGQRPGTGVTGMLRFNTTDNNLEIFDNSSWSAVGVPSFTVIADDQFSGDGSTVAFTLATAQTTNSCIVSINGVVQIPTSAYSVSGTTLTFTEAPLAGDFIDVREITTTTTVTSISNGSGNAEIGVSDTSATILTTGNIVPVVNVAYSLGNSTNRFANLWLAGNTLTLGTIVMKDTGGQVGFFEADGTTPATIDAASVDTTTIANGTSNVKVVSSNGNVTVSVGGTANIATFANDGVDVEGFISASGNIIGNYILGNGSQLTGIDATSIQNSSSSMAVIAPNGNIRANVNGSTIITITSNGIENGQANGTGNIGTASSYFNTVFAKATSAQYADLAEKYVADAEYAPGTVVVFGGTHEVTVNAVDADRKVAGVISTNPSYIMNGTLEAEYVATVALTGRVPCMVVGTVRKGDMMVAAGLGRARAESDPKVGTVIGKALEDFDGAEGTIEVVVGRF